MSRANLGQMAAAVYFAGGIQLKKDLNNLYSCVPLWGLHPPPLFIIDLSTTPEGLQEHLLEIAIEYNKDFYHCYFVSGCIPHLSPNVLAQKL